MAASGGAGVAGVFAAQEGRAPSMPPGSRVLIVLTEGATDDD